MKSSRFARDDTGLLIEVGQLIEKHLRITSDTSPPPSLHLGVLSDTSQ